MENLILECVARSILIAAFTAIAILVLQVKGARVRHSIWASVVVLMLVLPAWTLFGPKAILRILTPPAAVETTQLTMAVQTMPEPASSPVPVAARSWKLDDALLAIYLLGFGLLTARLLTGTLRARRLVTRAGNRGGRLTSDACSTPITVGWLMPAVILPADWMQWSGAELAAVLRHEDEHARRRDPLVQWLALLNRAVFWFHPLAWWLERRLSALAEEACDDAVLMNGHDPVQYSEWLLTLARAVRDSGSRVSAIGMAMPGAFLPQRIRRIVTGTPLQRMSRARMISVAVACALLSTLSTVVTVGYANPPAPKRVVATHAAVELSAPLADARPVNVASEVQVPRKPKRVLMAQAAPAPLPPGPSSGQSLFGVLLDPSGAVIPNIPVAVAGADAATVTFTDNLGRFRADNLRTGSYTVTVKAPGFKVLTRTAITLSDGEARNLGNLALTLGNVSESVSVSASRSVPATATPTATAPIGNPLGPATALGPLTTVPPATTTLEYKIPLFQPASGRPVRVGGMLEATKLIKAVKPVYPPELRRRGVEGTVQLQGVISKDGALTNVRVISSPDAGLTQAATDAVKQWLYKPTMLNGEPVEMLTTVDVNFGLTD